jgi:predicted DNA-binding transcriptional regulator AlpA
MTDDFDGGGYRYEDLKAARIVSNRTDLSRKQRELGFPLPIKTGERAAWFPKSEVHAWLKKRAALRKAPADADA